MIDPGLVAVFLLAFIFGTASRNLRHCLEAWIWRKKSCSFGNFKQTALSLTAEHTVYPNSRLNQRQAFAKNVEL